MTFRKNDIVHTVSGAPVFKLLTDVIDGVCSRAVCVRAGSVGEGTRWAHAPCGMCTSLVVDGFDLFPRELWQTLPSTIEGRWSELDTPLPPDELADDCLSFDDIERVSIMKTIAIDVYAEAS